MRVERLGQDKVRFFITFDDLMERGIEKEDMWRDIPKVHELFNDMMEHAYTEVGFEANGPVAVEVFALPAQGMVVIVTKGNKEAYEQEDYDTEDVDLEEEIYELEVTLEESHWLMYRFRDFEDVLAVAQRLKPDFGDKGKLYSYQQHYFLYFPEEELKAGKVEQLTMLLSEFGEPSTTTPHVLSEYGRLLIDRNAVNTLCHYFAPPAQG